MINFNVPAIVGKGVVEKITPESIKINGYYFSRKQFEFRVDVKKDSTDI